MFYFNLCFQLLGCFHLIQKQLRGPYQIYHTCSILLWVSTLFSVLRKYILSHLLLHIISSFILSYSQWLTKIISHFISVSRLKKLKDVIKRISPARKEFNLDMSTNMCLGVNGVKAERETPDVPSSKLVRAKVMQKVFLHSKRAKVRINSLIAKCIKSYGTRSCEQNCCVRKSKLLSWRM